MENSHGKEVKLGRTTVKIPGQRPRGSEAVLAAVATKNTNGGPTSKSVDSSEFIIQFI